MPIARGFTAHGHHPVFAIRNLVEPSKLLRAERFPVLQAPIWQPKPASRRRPFQAAAISDIFATQGFDDPDDLEPMVNAWQHLIDVVRPVLGPFRPLPSPAPLPENSGFFAYIAADHTGFKQVTAGIGAAETPGCMFLRSAPAEIAQFLGDKGHHVFDNPPRLVDVLPHVRAVLHHGGIGTTEICVGMGRPQLLFPRHLEQWLTARALKKLGVARWLAGKFPGDAVTGALADIIEDEALAERAQEFAREIAARDQADNIGRIVAECLGIISGSHTDPVAE